MPFNIAVVGATGKVGQVMREILKERNFPIDNIRFMSSSRSAGSQLDWEGSSIEVEDANKADFSNIDFAIFSAGATASKELAPKAVECGAVVIDNSSAWRMDPEVPLVVAEINPHALKNIKKGIVGNPNCTTMVGMMALAPLHKKANLKKLIVSTYQAVSGAGQAGVEELVNQSTQKSLTLP